MDRRVRPMVTLAVNADRRVRLSELASGGELRVWSGWPPRVRDHRCSGWKWVVGRRLAWVSRKAVLPRYSQDGRDCNADERPVPRRSMLTGRRACTYRPHTRCRDGV